jgi:hypothetical protein
LYPGNASIELYSAIIRQENSSLLLRGKKLNSYCGGVSLLTSFTVYFEIHLTAEKFIVERTSSLDQRYHPGRNWEAAHNSCDLP